MKVVKRNPCIFSYRYPPYNKSFSMKWKVHIKINNQNFKLDEVVGTYDTYDDAKDAFDEYLDQNNLTSYFYKNI